jgi:predicted secreted protein
MKRFLSLVLFPLLCVCPCTGGVSDPTGQAGKAPVLTGEWNGRTVALRIDDELRIELPISGGTGYAWYFTHLDRNLFELVSEETRALPGDRREAPGSPVWGVWILRARQSGSGVLRMSYYRIWEGPERAANHFEVTVQIAP